MVFLQSIAWASAAISICHDAVMTTRIQWKWRTIGMTISRLRDAYFSCTVIDNEECRGWPAER